MSKDSAEPSKGQRGLIRVASFIVDKRMLFFLIYIIATIFSLVASNWVQVNNDLTDFSQITSDEVVTAEYTRFRELLASEQARESGLSVIQVDGSFREEDELTVTEESAQGSEAERWTIVIPDDGNAAHQIRFLAADNAGSGQVKLYLVQDGKKTQIESSSLSDYLTFTAEGSEITFAVESAAGRIRTVVIIACAAAVAIAIILILYTGLRRSRRRRGKAR